MNWRWLALVGMSFVLSACEHFEPCSDPGGISKVTCYNYETIRKITTITPGYTEVMGQVAESVIREDSSKLRNSLNYKLDQYPFHHHTFRVQDSDIAKLEINKSYMFVTEPNQPILKICTTEECTEAVRKFAEFTKP